ncbi:AbrB/MazE/SpoVT family DNA-binding domain-containing protein (plasmid) [Bacillus mycoides]|uniref:AbrB/MazE/SpoVT family DNA-binding domain-containing protein n=1 Tax=Bacillus mycoides TaxID=1405 RepID=UPI001C01C19C|nr:AbrB/MazE/SpoVT family DNA-binding domain-containing protein [Bacillus mycoides]QWH64190.1 AbrB/MazE/SpoVT family DNA-binding domain-containing protein [Bacillus mycoides]
MKKGGVPRKSTGVTCKIDPLGRVVIPKELRRTLRMEENPPMEIFVEGEQIILQKYTSPETCLITGDISKRNVSFTYAGIVLSPEGAKYVVKGLQQYLAK